METFDWIGLAICSLILIIMPIIRYINKCTSHYNLFNKVGWIITPNRARNLPCRYDSLPSRISYEQQKLDIPDEIRLNGSNEIEEKHTLEILEAFKKYISEEYFAGCLSTSAKIRRLTDEAYLMYSLFQFSDKYAELDNYVLRDKIYKYESENGSYLTYRLTDYGRTFYKIYLISLLYIENNPYTLKLFEYIDPKLKEWLKSYLKTNKITFWRYRP